LIAYLTLVRILIWLIFFGLIFLDRLFALLMACAILGISSTLTWFLGNISQTVEYWNCSGPRWMRFLGGNPKIVERNIMKVSKRYKCNSGNYIKILALVEGVFIVMLILLVFISSSYVVIGYLLIWMLGIYVSETYFKRMYSRGRFTRISEDSDI
jgi:hypothetical protein